MLKKLAAYYLILFFSIIHLFTPVVALAQSPPASGENTVGPELAVPIAGANVVAAQNYSGVVSVINYINIDGPIAVNTVPDKSLNKPIILRVDFTAATSTDDMVKYAESLNSVQATEFPGGIDAIVLYVEANNLVRWYKDSPGATFSGDSASIQKAAGEYAAHFLAFANAYHGGSPLAVAPPDLYNPEYLADPWMDAINTSGVCSHVGVSTAIIFEVPPAVGSGYTWDNIYQYQEQRLCPGAPPVTHFQGWGPEPNLSSPPTVRQQVDWYASHPLPAGVETATTLIIPNCPPKYTAGADANGDFDWWYYINGRVFTKEGNEINPDTCELEQTSCALEKYPEYHSLRPNPYCPFNENETDISYYMCGHDLVAKEQLVLTGFDPGLTGITNLGCQGLPDGSQTCNYQITNQPISNFR